MTAMTIRRFLSMGLLLAALPALAGCGPLGALRRASTPLDTYTLQAATLQEEVRSTARHILVEPPAASGAIDTDRILVKPNQLQVQYLAGARWVDPAPELMQALLVESLQNTGAFRFVTRTTTGPFPDYTLLSEIIDFQAEATGDPQLPLLVRVTLSLALVREDDGAIVSARRVTAVRATPRDDVQAVVTAFDGASDDVLTQSTRWVLSLFGIRTS
jgi:cholesterol transport system auxiliary component